MLPVEESPVEVPVSVPIVSVPGVLEPAEPVVSVGTLVPLVRVPVPGADELSGPVLDTPVVPDKILLRVPETLSVDVVPSEAPELGSVVAPLLVSLGRIVVPVEVKVDVTPSEPVVIVSVGVEMPSVPDGPVVLPLGSPPPVVESVLNSY